MRDLVEGNFWIFDDYFGLWALLNLKSVHCDCYLLGFGRLARAAASSLGVEDAREARVIL